MRKENGKFQASLEPVSKKPNYYNKVIVIMMMMIGATTWWKRSFILLTLVGFVYCIS
jgi:hypothetical protein